MERASADEQSKKSSAARIRLRRAAWLAIAAWTLFLLGALGMLVDGAIRMPSLFSWTCLTAVFAGAALFAISVVLRTPTAPQFLAGLPDPWEEEDRLDRYRRMIN